MPQKLTVEQIKWARSFYRKGEHGRGTIVIANQLNVTPRTAWDIVNNRIWKHVT